jgi:hypothetical protein
MTYKELRQLDHVMMVEEYKGKVSKPLVAVVPYDEYLRMQTLVIKAEEAIDRYLSRISDPPGSRAEVGARIRARGLVASKSS